MKKNKGTVGKMAVPLLAILASVMLIVIYSNSFKEINIKGKGDAIARNYLLRMESNGYLRENDEKDLIKDLHKIGLVNVSLTGTTRKPVGYGNQIRLEITGDIRNKELKTNGFNTSNQEVLKPIEIGIESTAKC